MVSLERKMRSRGGSAAAVRPSCLMIEPEYGPRPTRPLSDENPCADGANTVWIRICYGSQESYTLKYWESIVYPANSIVAEKTSP